MLRVDQLEQATNSGSDHSRSGLDSFLNYHINSICFYLWTQHLSTCLLMICRHCTSQTHSLYFCSFLSTCLIYHVLFHQFLALFTPRHSCVLFFFSLNTCLTASFTRSISLFYRSIVTPTLHTFRK